MKKQINIAIVAYGRIAKTHILAVYMSNMKMNLPFQMRVSHIITSHPESVKVPNVRVCTNLEEALICGEEIDIVDICNINEAHYESIKIALKYNKAIYCEKPLTDCFSKSDEVTRLVKEKKVLNAVPLIFRYIPCVQMLKNELSRKSFGKVIGFECKYYHNSYLDENKRNTWRTGKSSGGGASIDLGIHMLDFIRYIFGNPVKNKIELRTHFKGVETDEVYKSTLTFAEGFRGDVTASRVYHQQKQKNYIEIFCEGGSYFCDFSNPYVLECNEFNGSTLLLKPQSLDQYMQFLLAESDATTFHLDAHICCLADFARCVCGVTYGGYFADFEQATQSQKLLY